MDTPKTKILIVDDEQVICDLLSEDLEERGYQCTTALDATTASSELESQNFDVILIDIRLPGGASGMDLLHRISYEYPQLTPIMITAINEVHTAVEAMKLGAADYIVKPFDSEKVQEAVSKALQSKQQRAQREGTAMEAIERGIAAHHGFSSKYWNTITEETIQAARRLEIPDPEIEKWVIRRNALSVAVEKMFDLMGKTGVAK